MGKLQVGHGLAEDVLDFGLTLSVLIGEKMALNLLILFIFPSSKLSLHLSLIGGIFCDTGSSTAGMDISKTVSPV